jgi:hypothetical protein
LQGVLTCNVRDITVPSVVGMINSARSKGGASPYRIVVHLGIDFKSLRVGAPIIGRIVLYSWCV